VMGGIQQSVGSSWEIKRSIRETRGRYLETCWLKRDMMVR